MFICTNSLCFQPCTGVALLSHLLGWAGRETLNVSCISTSKCYSNTPTCTHSHIHQTPFIDTAYTTRSQVHLYNVLSDCVCMSVDVTLTPALLMRSQKENSKLIHKPIPDPIRTVVTERQAAYLLLNFTLLWLCLTLNSPCLTNTSAFLYLPLEESLYSSMTMLGSALEGHLVFCTFLCNISHM